MKPTTFHSFSLHVKLSLSTIENAKHLAFPIQEVLVKVMVHQRALCPPNNKVNPSQTEELPTEIV